ncbi:MAG: sulfatase-like hydrolase/transferase, partial [Lentimonas sp.]
MTHSLIKKLTLVGASLFCAAAVPAVAQSKQPAEKPNVIMIFTDDLGIGMLGCYGQKIVTTPHIDRLAEEG